jgi:hypothetical protein
MNRITAALLATALLATGCYSYVPTTLGDVNPGSSVRVRISGAEADRLEPIRFTDSRNLEGAIVRKDDDQIYIDAVIRTVDAHGITAQHVQRLNIAPREIQDVQYRRLDYLKSAAAVGGVSFLLGAAAWAVIWGDLGRTDEFEPIDQFRVRIPLLRFSP